MGNGIIIGIYVSQECAKSFKQNLKVPCLFRLGQSIPGDMNLAIPILQWLMALMAKNSPLCDF